MSKTSCYTCLSTDRKLTPLKPQEESLFTLLCPEMCSLDCSQYLICWECEFMVIKIKRFQARLTRANNILKLFVKGKAANYKGLSSLKLTAIETVTIAPQNIPTLPQNTPTLPQNTPTLPQNTITLPQNTPTLPQITPTLPQYTPTLPQNTPTLPQNTPTLPQNTPTLPQNVATQSQNTLFTSLKEMLAAPLRLDPQTITVKVEEEDEDEYFDDDYDNLIQPTTIQQLSDDPLMIPKQNKTEIKNSWAQIEVPKVKPVKAKTATPKIINYISQKVFINAPKEEIAPRGLREPVKVTGSVANLVTNKEITANSVKNEENNPSQEKTESRILNLDKLLTRLLATPSRHDELLLIKQHAPNDMTPSKEPENSEPSTSSEDAAKCILLDRTEVNALRDKKRLIPAYKSTRFKCEKCIEGFQSKEKLDEHNMKHDESRGNIICEICERRFADDRVYDEHYQQHFMMYGCLKCPYQNTNRLRISEHYYKNHEESSFFCRQCHKSFKTYSERRRHIFNTHNKKIKCEECGKTFSRTQLRMHMANIHRGETVECPICKKKLRKYYLKYHMKTHDEKREDSAYCVDCGTTYKSKHSYELHLKTSLKHNTIEKLGIKCEHCDKYFNNKQALKNHVEEVIGVKYTCDICGKDSKNKTILIKHIRVVHEGQKPKLKTRMCEICGKSFTVRKSLEEHLNSHLGRRPHVCKDCGATFIYSAALFTHRRLVHKVKRKFEMTS